ncbi:DNA repair ATPase [Streptomyces sp. MUM 203J]|uniref:DNA repair ATPase n=1 Tax=Streptomyces sp. MUM 203J TaxID=2791990 RepID=UPI001F04698D|nr:DNA repair ATPase [Streptomyces sp. MUM 203J]MCH0539778.1 DNA repair ATPase [Streptomyces sp. MUM 203J]
MSTNETSGAVMDASAYDVLRERLAAQGAGLAARAQELNARRAEVFGAAELRLDGTERLRTEASALARDVVAVGNTLLVGYSGVAGPEEVRVGDVFALHAREGLEALARDAVPGLLDDPSFVREFQGLHRYYRGSRLLRLRLADGKLLAVFRTGERAEDIRVLRWRLRRDGSAQFLDARGERDHVLPPAHDVTWTAATREDHGTVDGTAYARVPGDVELYAGTTGGTLTVRDAEGVLYEEPVTEPLQSLADADIAHARVGALLLLRVRPYKEDTDRYLAVSVTTRTVARLDGIGQACRRLPGGQGVVFPGGYCLADGTHRTFGTDAEGMEFERAVHSPNGEDVLYVFQARGDGRTLLLPYNLIRRSVAAPVACQGYALFEDGTLHVLRAPADGEPARVHPVQVWRSPYVSDTFAAAQPVGEGPLERIGNPDLVRAVSDCLAVARTASAASAPDAEPTTEAYEDLAGRCARALDAYHWLADPEAGGGVLEPLAGLRETAEQVLAEFAAVRELKRQAAEALAEAASRVATLVRRMRGEAPRTAPEWVERLTGLRRAQGRLVTLKEMRYADAERIDELAADVGGDLEVFGGRAVEFLSRDDAFVSYDEEVEQLTARAEGIGTAAEAEPLAALIDTQAEGLRTVTEVVTGLDIGDATLRTAILERISAVLGGVNRARATLDARRRELAAGESRAEFAAETALLGQAVTGALAAADTPEACDGQLAGLLLRLENLEARFGASDEASAVVAAKRDEVYEAFAARKQALQDERARHAERLASSAGRVLETVARRLASLADQDEINTFFASDPLVAKVRRSAEELRGLGESARAEELEGRITAARQEAARALRDRTDLYADGGAAIRLGRHRFAVNTQPVDLTLVPSGDDTLVFAVPGTDYRAPVTDEGFAGTRAFWGQSLPSENADVYRAEFLAVRLLGEHGAEALAAAGEAGELDGLVREAAREAYDEGYELGVHDRDAALILAAVLRLHAGAGLLRYPARARGAAQEFWAYGVAEDAVRAAWTVRARSLARAREAFGAAPGLDGLRGELAAAMAGAGSPMDAAVGAAYLVEELAAGPEGFVAGAAARTLVGKFRGAVDLEAYEQDLAGIADLGARRMLVESWLSAYAAATGEPVADGDLAEAVVLELCPELPRYDREAELTARAEGLLGTHPRVEGRALTIRLDELLARVEGFRRDAVPAFRAYQKRRAALVAAERERLGLDAYRPRAMASFVRGRLVDEVYLPLVGDSLNKQMGPGSHGLLLLVSPPGYGKTTLMEYVAERLGMLLVKVDGPALGHDVTSLDPAEAPHSAARRELEKVRFALSAGNNVLLHIDDVQHTSPELLQKFIPLCDATRALDGYDLRGKRFAVCMTANPYTESGSRFRIPDMLANRADVWNLGDVLGGKEDAFALSFVENALTANPVLAPLAGRDLSDLDALVRMAAGDPGAPGPDRLSHPYAASELNEVLAVLRHLLTARRTVLAVNAAYIASAAQSDETRTEPRFQLQGSYRDMNKIAARISPVMNEAELAAVVQDHYTAEAQTLTSGAEANLLKLAELQGALTPEQSARWAELKAAHGRARALGDPEEDPVVRAVAALGLLADRIAAIESAITRAADPRMTLANPHARHASRPAGEAGG